MREKRKNGKSKRDERKKQERKKRRRVITSFFCNELFIVNGEAFYIDLLVIVGV
jgi:hypothetical protein